MVDNIDYVDAHFHIWDLQKFSYPWPTARDAAIFKNFSVEDLKAVMQGTGVKHAVFVQVLNKHLEETRWLCQLAEQHDVIKGVVAGLDVTDKELPSTLNSLPISRIVGVRYILDPETDELWLTRSDVIAGLRVLQDRGIPFELLLRPHLMKYVPELSKELPRLKMVVDHLAKPNIKDGQIDEWTQGMTAIASNPNIYCKLSGLVTEADLLNWKEDDFEPYVRHALDCFGSSRCMFGSDWPVCALAGASYVDVFNIMFRLVKKVSPGNEVAIFRNNAVKFYGLKL